MLAIHALTSRAQLDEGTVRAFLRRHDFPIVEGPDITFVYRGEADEVRLRHWVYGLPSDQPLTRISGTNVWYCMLNLPPGSRMEYKFEVLRHGQSQWLADPLNPRMARDPFGGNSVAMAEGYSVPEWVHSDPDVREGVIEELRFEPTPFGDARRVSVYLPARFRRTRRYPLLMVHDGGDFLNYARLKTVLDNLIHRQEVAPLIVALTHPSDRLVEYPDNPEHADFLCRDVLAELQRRYPLDDRPFRRGLMGASFGAVAALSTAWRYPRVFGNLMLLSGSFAFSDIGHQNRRGPAFEPVISFVNSFRQLPGRPCDRAYVACGMYESLIYENRSLVPLLQARRIAVRYEEVRDGHNWENWRDRLRSGLSWLFPGPVWMVYE